MLEVKHRYQVEALAYLASQITNQGVKDDVQLETRRTIINEVMKSIQANRFLIVTISYLHE